MSLTVTHKRRACEYTKAIYWKLQWAEAVKQDPYFLPQNTARWTEEIYNEQSREKIPGFIPPTSQRKLSDCRSESSLPGTRDFSWGQSTNGSVPRGNAWKGFHHYLEVRTHWQIRRCGFNTLHIKRVWVPICWEGTATTRGGLWVQRRTLPPVLYAVHVW